jgi:hypothetical protein
MTTQEKIEMIKALTEVIRANNGFWGSEDICRMANEKIEQLIKQI